MSTVNPQISIWGGYLKFSRRWGWEGRGGFFKGVLNRRGAFSRGCLIEEGAYLIFSKWWPDMIIFNTSSAHKQQHKLFKHVRLMCSKTETMHKSKTTQQKLDSIHPLLSQYLSTQWGEGRGHLFKRHLGGVLIGRGCLFEEGTYLRGVLIQMLMVCLIPHSHQCIRAVFFLSVEK